MGKAGKIRSFSDKSLGDGVFFLELLDGLKKGYVDWSLVESAKGEKECKANGQSSLTFSLRPRYSIYENVS